MQDIMKLCDVVRETGYAAHRYLRNRHVEKVYENSLTHRLQKQGLKVVQQHPLSVFDEDGTLLGDFKADLFIEDRLIVELKAVRHASDEHVAQLPAATKVWGPARRAAPRLIPSTNECARMPTRAAAPRAWEWHSSTASWQESPIAKYSAA